MNSPHFKITTTHLRTPPRGTPKVVAVYSFRYDESLVPDMLENIRDMVHAVVACDDRAAGDALSDEHLRRNALNAAARAAGADWILAVDPDERYEPALARLMPVLTAPRDRPVLWSFRTREMFTMTTYRSDGVWGGKGKTILYPASTTHGALDQGHHGPWVRRDPAHISLDSGLNLYHLRHMSEKRTEHRRKTWAAADPGRGWQSIGWDYLSDLRGARFDTVPPDRRYLPDREPDDGLWAVEDTTLLGDSPPDPIDCQFNRITAFRNRAGAAQAAHVAADIAAADPGDTDLPLLAAALHLRAQDPVAALATLPSPGADTSLFASLLRGRAALARGDRETAVRAARSFRNAPPPTTLHAALFADATRAQADFTAPEARWRAQAEPGETAIAEGTRNGTGPLCTIVISHAGGPSPRAAIDSLAGQSDATEIVLVHSGSTTLPDLGPLDDRVRRIAVERPLYVGAARNIGILASRGDYVAFLAGDCRVEPGWTEGRLARHATGALSISSSFLPEKPGSLIGQITAVHVFPRRDPWLTPELNGHYSRSYHRRIFSESGCFAPNRRVGEDTDFNNRVDGIAPPLWAPEIAIRHRDPKSLRALFADIRCRAARAGNSYSRAGGPAPDWIDRNIASRRVILARCAADNPAGPPSLLLRFLGELAFISFERGLRDSNALLQKAAAHYRAAYDLPPEKASEAAALYAQAAAIMPQVAAYHVGQGRSLYRADRLEESIAAFDAAIAINPNDGSPLQQLVTALTNLDRQPEALARAEAISVIAPDSDSVARAAGTAALAARRPRIALFHAQRALAINPADPAVHQLLARVHRRLGNTDMADRRTRMAEAIAAAIERRKAAIAEKADSARRALGG